MSGENKKYYNIADPNLIKLKKKDYLVLTTYDSETDRPSVCFYELRKFSEAKPNEEK